MNWSAYLLKFSLIATCGVMMMTSSDYALLEMIDMASSTPKKTTSKPAVKAKAKTAAKSAQYVEKIYPLAIVERSSSVPKKAAAVAAAPKTTLPTQRATVSKDADQSLSENAVKKVDKMNKIGELLAAGNGDNNSNANCTNCSLAGQVAELKYNQCSGKDDYLENDLEAKEKSRSYIGVLIRSDMSNKPMIRPVCIETAMFLQSSQSGPVVNYKTCSNGVAKNAPSRPCVSERYFTLVNNSFEVVSQCMKTYIGEGESAIAQKQNIREVFGMITVESGFHINITSKTGAGGIGQFTSPAINAVNKVISETESYLANHSDVRCQKLAAEFLGDKNLMKTNATCDRVSIKEGNPVTNLIYTYAALKEAKDYFDDNVYNEAKIKAKFALSSNDMAKIKRATMIWSHNTGFAGLKTPLTKLLTTKYAKKKVTNADTFLAELKQYAASYPNKGNAGSRSRIKETANYYAKIQHKIDLVEEGAAGGSCLN
jgi:hypothetical protein